MTKRVSSRFAILAAAALALLAGHDAPAGGNIARAQLFYVSGSAAGRDVGDILSASDGLDLPYNFFVEVPPGTTTLTIQGYDIDVGAQTTGDTVETGGGNSHELDRVRTNDDTSTRYRVFNPAGTQVSTRTDDDSDNALHDVWTTLHTTANPAAGHWRVEVNATDGITSGDDLNAYGIRAHDGTPGTGGTELNVYADSYVMLGSHNDTNKTYTLYPYITSGCTFFPRDFDADDDSGQTNSQYTGTSRNGAFVGGPTTINSDNNVWGTSPTGGVQSWADAGVGVTAGSLSEGAGIWRFSMTDDASFDQAANYIPVYFAAFNSPSAPFSGADEDFEPNSNPEENAFRIYLPRDGSTVANPLAPNKTFLRQSIYSVVSGPNPPDTGQTTRLTIEVEVVNPEAFPVTFSSTNTVTVRVPAAPVVYRPPALITQGSFVSQPANGASNGNIVWNPGTLAAGATARLRYNVDVTPSANGQVITLTGTPAANGTTARFVDITGNTTQARATYTFGPICELRVTEGGSVLAVNLVSLTAEAEEGDPVAVSWATSEEIDNAGFLVYEAQLTENKLPVVGAQLTADLIPAQSSSGAEYLWVDERPWSSDTPRGYYLADIDLNGTVTYHGPVWVNGVVGAITAVEEWKAY